MYFSGRLWLGEKGRGRKPKQQKKRVGEGEGRDIQPHLPFTVMKLEGAPCPSGPRVRLSQQTAQQHLWEAAFLPHIVVVKRHRSLSSIIQRVWDLCRRDPDSLALQVTRCVWWSKWARRQLPSASQQICPVMWLQLWGCTSILSLWSRTELVLRLCYRCDTQEWLSEQQLEQTPFSVNSAAAVKVAWAFDFEGQGTVT